jgi:hypothetical protein
MSYLDIECACVSADARECIRIRYNRPLTFMCDDPTDYGDDDFCECSCHDVNEDEYDDWCGR